MASVFNVSVVVVDGNPELVAADSYDIETQYKKASKEKLKTDARAKTTNLMAYMENQIAKTSEYSWLLIKVEKLSNGKGKKVGFIESMGLKIAGYCDGRKGFPRQTDVKGWYSPFMNRDVNIYEEFCSHIWASLQIENEGTYVKLEKLMDKIQQKKGLLDASKYGL